MGHSLLRISVTAAMAVRGTNRPSTPLESVALRAMALFKPTATEIEQIVAIA
jgi:hypothetical protein